MSRKPRGDYLEGSVGFFDMAIIAAGFSELQGFLESVSGEVKVAAGEVGSGESFEEKVSVEGGLFVKCEEEGLDGGDGLFGGTVIDVDHGELMASQEVGPVATVLFPDGDGLSFGVTGGGEVL